MILDQDNIKDACITVGEFTQEIEHLWETLSFKQYHILKEQLKDTNNKQVIKQKICTYIALSHLYGDHFTLKHLPSGKPILNDHIPISISHSGNYVTIIRHAEKAVGIDLELRTRNALKAISRVSTEAEMKLIHSHAFPNDLALLFWCAKETAYKMFSEWDLDLLGDIEVISNEVDFDLNNCLIGTYGYYRAGDLKVLVRGEEYLLNYKITCNFILCWGVCNS